MLGRSDGSGRVIHDCLVGQWIVGVISFQKIFGLHGLKGLIVEKRKDVTHVHCPHTTECEDEARILESEFVVNFHQRSMLCFA